MEATPFHRLREALRVIPLCSPLCVPLSRDRTHRDAERRSSAGGNRRRRRLLPLRWNCLFGV